MRAFSKYRFPESVEGIVLSGEAIEEDNRFCDECEMAQCICPPHTQNKIEEIPVSDPEKFYDDNRNVKEKINEIIRHLNK